MALTASPIILKANLWSANRRLQEAASVPFRSIHAGGHDDEITIGKLQKALQFIEENSEQFPPRLLPHAHGPDGPPNAGWGPFFWDTNETVWFDPYTYYNVRKFQKQANVDADGKAGMQTLPKLDELLVFLGRRAEIE